jgi:hypothetical protein
MSNPSGTFKTWTLTHDMSQVSKTQVFSGGACNILNTEGQLLRNTERDAINDWLTQQGIYFFDPQIHPETHGREYDYAADHKLEVAARAAAQVNLYEVSPRTFGGITSLEIAWDQFRWQEPTVIYFSDGDAARDDLPAHSKQGHPLFVPDGIRENEAAMRAHYREFVKNGNNMRKYLMNFARQMDTLTINFSDQIHADDVVITPERIHAADLFRAVVQAASNRRTFVTFTGGRAARDDKGNPVFIVPPDPPEVQKMVLLDQYVDEGNELRRSIAELVSITVFTRVVYTQRSAILALEEVLRTRGIRGVAS